MRSRMRVWLNLVILGITLGRTYSAFQRAWRDRARVARPRVARRKVLT
jgi:hypothetical protein